jgi:tRNA(Ile)-lysidine synthase
MAKPELSLPAGYAETTPVLVAFSGGADSSLLLHLLHERAKKYGAPIYAVHVHHGIRGSEADADLDFCRQTCRTLHVPFFAVRVNVPAQAKALGQSIEEAARHARYRHFARLMQKHHIPLLATAHHADDNLETVLFRICRGTGTQGLRGIPAFSPLPDAPGDSALCVFRPLLHLTKQEILDDCRKRGIAFVTDSTNACNDYARNRIRNLVIPELQTLFARPQHAASRLCRAADEDNDALDTIAAQLYREHQEHGALPIMLLRSQPPAISKRLIRLAYTAYSLEHGDGHHMPEAVHLDAAMQQIRSEKPGFISFPCETCAAIDRDALRFCKSDSHQAQPYLVPLQSGLFEIPEAGIAVWAQFPENAETVTAFATNVYNLYTELHVRFDTIKGRAFLRPIREGDVVLQGGMHKRIRKLYGQHGVPLALRARLPLLCDLDGVIAVPGICMRDGSKAKNAEKTLCIRIYLQKQFDT